MSSKDAADTFRRPDRTLLAAPLAPVAAFLRRFRTPHVPEYFQCVACRSNAHQHCSGYTYSAAHGHDIDCDCSFAGHRLPQAPR